MGNYSEENNEYLFGNKGHYNRGGEYALRSVAKNDS